MLRALCAGARVAWAGHGAGARGMARVRAGGAQAGVGRRTRALQEGGVQLDPGADLEELLEDSELDLRQIHHAYGNYRKETSAHADMVRHKIVEQKYFKENHPNLLMWSEKEQIRHLGIEQPGEWTPERLAESFPVTPAVVKKLLKFPWRPATETRIARHDASAMRNWKELRDGNLDIPKELQERFLKFSNRTIPQLNKSAILPEGPTSEQIGEFQSIIEQCAARQKAREEDQSKDKMQNLQIAEPKSTQRSEDYKGTLGSKRFTLDQLKRDINTRVESGRNVNLNDKFILESTVVENSGTLVSTATDSLEVFKEDTKAVSSIMEKESEPSVYPERIRIPKLAWKKGCTYKVDDCYYDYDGRFLYRVPGLKGKLNQ